MPVIVHCSAAKNRERFKGSILANNVKQIKKPALIVRTGFIVLKS
ncbi:Uncharacterised protein [Chryseobacterium taklimakanense]|uniref:Uncharacterized protein n=1 Tax=Chryseobacterium taklimakanense TaxID=536441 RepID=A0A239XB23_9FLAO|nr:Uncharacterised protein [Chryseobacterium taklimakanense]